MRSVDWIGLLMIVVFVLGAAVLAAAEVVITRTSRPRAYRLREENQRGAASLAKLVENPASHLNVVLLLTLLLQLAGTTIAAALALRAFGGYGNALATFAMTVLLFVFAEATPKTFALQHTDRTALRLAPFILALGAAFGPAARFLIGLTNLIIPGKGLKEGPFVTEAEIRAMAEMASKEKAIAQEEEQLIRSIFEFGDTLVHEVMTPRPDIVALEVNTPLLGALDVVIKHGYSRIPVFDSRLDDIVGVLYAKDLVYEVHAGNVNRRLADIVQKPQFVPESKKVSELLKEMRLGKFHMALVVDEHGTLIGLATLEDVLEEIVGEIADEYDREEPNVAPLGTTRYRVKARMPVDQLSEILNVKLPSGEWDTVGGLLAGVLGHLPAQGEQVELDTIRFTAERVHGRRISEILLEQLGRDEPTDVTRRT